MQYREQGVMVAENRDDYIAKLKQAAGLRDEDLEKLRKKLEALAESNTGDPGFHHCGHGTGKAG